MVPNRSLQAFVILTNEVTINDSQYNSDRISTEVI